MQRPWQKHARGRVKNWPSGCYPNSIGWRLNAPRTSCSLSSDAFCSMHFIPRCCCRLLGSCAPGRLLGLLVGRCKICTIGGWKIRCFIALKVSLGGFISRPVAGFSFFRAGYSIEGSPLRWRGCSFCDHLKRCSFFLILIGKLLWVIFTVRTGCLGSISMYWWDESKKTFGISYP